MRRTNRRNFLKSTAAAGVGFWAAGGVSLAADKPRAASDKLNVAFVGVGGMGGGNLGSIAGLGENVVALCDIDDQILGGAAKKHPNAKTYNDYRKMFDEQKDIDAVVVSTPDHSHAPAGLIALRLKKHLYCEKPLTYTVNEARLMRKTAAEQNVATCMGNRGTAEDGFRRGVEILQAGLIGPVKEVHVWTNRPIWPQGMDRPKETPEVPSHLHWDLWQGPAKERPFHPAYLHFKWRGWMDYGTGALGDMACHTCNLPYMGLKLGAPTSIEAVSSGLNGESWPDWSTIVYEFPARSEGFPAVRLIWYDGIKNAAAKEQNLPPAQIIKGLTLPKDKTHSGMVMIGSKGVLFSANDYGSAQKFYTLEREPMEVKAPEPTLPRAPKNNNYADWIRACKSGEKALANFDYAARLTEAILLGNVAMRAGRKIDYDGEQMKITNHVDANKYLTREYRKGFGI